MLKLDPFSDAVKILGDGGMVVLVDDTDREDEADLIVAAERITPEHLAFMFTHGRTVVCLTLTQEKLRELGLPMQVAENGSPLGPNFAVSFDHRSVLASGVTAEGRAKTILEAIKEPSNPSEFVRPGFVFPLGALPGGVLSRRGHTEGSVDLARLAGCLPAAVICEVMGEDGTMLRGQGVRDFCDRHKLPLVSIAQLVKHRSQNEMSVRRLSEMPLESLAKFTRREDLSALFSQVSGKTRVILYVDDVDRREHFAIVCGEPRENALVRVHSECLTGDVFGSRRCDCGYQLSESLRQIFSAGEGVLVYLHQEGRGIGLANKLRAYELQDQGRDTVQANLELGFEVDSRSYRAAAHILGDLGVRSVRLMTNNPGKIQSLEEFGIPVRERVGIEAPVDEFNRGYLQAKKAKLGHLLGAEKII